MNSEYQAAYKKNKMWLASLRLNQARRCCSEGDVKEILEIIEHHRKAANVSYADLETTAEELLALELRGYIAEAKKWLHYVRNSDDKIGRDLDYMEEYRKKANASYADIGTTSEEVALLKQRAV